MVTDTERLKQHARDLETRIAVLESEIVDMRKIQIAARKELDSLISAINGPDVLRDQLPLPGPDFSI